MPSAKRKWIRTSCLKLDYAIPVMDGEGDQICCERDPRQDVREFLGLAAEANIKPDYQEYDLEDANTGSAGNEAG